MSTENPNNDFHWGGKLDSLEQLPGGNFDKNASWDRLHSRLGEKKDNRKIFWYWLAAACLVMVFMISLINRDKSPAHLPKSEAVAKQTPKTDKLIQSADPVKIPPTAIIAQPVIPAKLKRNHQPDVHRMVAIQPVILAQENSGPRFDTQGIHNMQISAPTSPVIYAVVPAKKLAVVHINELGDPVTEYRDVAHTKTKHSIKIELGNQEVVTTSSITQQPRGFTILKSKTSSN